MKKLIELMMTAVILAGVVPICAAAEPDTQPAPAAGSEVMTAAEMEAKGDALRKQKEFPQAMQYYRAALRKEPTNAVLYNKLGMAELQSGNRKAGQTHFDKANKLDPNFADPVN